MLSFSVPIDDGRADNGAGAIAPSQTSVADGTYQPLSRPIFIYVNRRAADRGEVDAFVRFYLSKGRPLVTEVGYIQLPKRAYELVEQRFELRTVGSVFGGGGSRVGVSVEQALTAP